jgi:hypothetical protein
LTIKRSADIESVLGWAYREQLPLKYISSANGIWDKIGGIGIARDANARRDGSSAQRYPQFGLPHPDADLIERAVSACPAVEIDWQTEGPWIMGDLFGLLTHNAAVSVGSFRAAAWVVQHASMNTRPKWRIDDPRPYPVKAERGPGYKIVGECLGKNRYSTWSYCPLEWRPTIIDIAEARAEYLVWWRALTDLAKRLKGALETWLPQPPTAVADPWRVAEPVRACHLLGPSESQWHRRPLPLSLPRPRAGAPLKYRLSQGIPRRSA